MSETKFTKGEWKVEQGNTSYLGLESFLKSRPNAFVINIKASAFALGRCGAIVLPSLLDDEESEANAHLMAASPDLYAALDSAMVLLEAMNARCTGDTAFILRCRAALAKARGESSEVPA
jgi:hypothetical protein